MIAEKSALPSILPEPTQISGCALFLASATD